MIIADVIKSSTALKATLAGVQRKFSVGLGIKRFIYTAHNNPKQGLRAAFGSTDYPYGWFKCTTLSLDTERANMANLGRFGSGLSLSVSESSASIVQNFYFPVTMQVDCEVKFNALEPGLLFIQQVLLASPTKMLNFEVHMPSDKWTVEVVNDGNSMPMPNIEDLDDGSTPGSYTIQFQLTVKTKIGFNTETAKINNQGEVLMDVSLDTGDDLEYKIPVKVNKE